MSLALYSFIDILNRVTVNRTSRHSMSQFPPATDSCPQAACRLSYGHPAGQAETPQRLPDARQHAWLYGLPQVFMGNIVYSSQLFAVVVPQVTELLGCGVRDDGGPGWRAGHGRGRGVVRTMFLPHSLRGGGFPFGTLLNWMCWCFATVNTWAVCYVHFNIHLN